VLRNSNFENQPQDYVDLEFEQTDQAFLGVQSSSVGARTFYSRHRIMRKDRIGKNDKIHPWYILPYFEYCRRLFGDTDSS